MDLKAIGEIKLIEYQSLMKLTSFISYQGECNFHLDYFPWLFQGKPWNFPWLSPPPGAIPTSF